MQICWELKPTSISFKNLKYGTKAALTANKKKNHNICYQLTVSVINLEILQAVYILHKRDPANAEYSQIPRNLCTTNNGQA